MEYQKIIKLQDNTNEQQSKLRTKKWIQVSDYARGT